jgi:hypothetical protein
VFLQAGASRIVSFTGLTMHYRQIKVRILSPGFVTAFPVVQTNCRRHSRFCEAEPNFPSFHSIDPCTQLPTERVRRTPCACYTPFSPGYSARRGFDSLARKPESLFWAEFFLRPQRRALCTDHDAVSQGATGIQKKRYRADFIFSDLGLVFPTFLKLGVIFISGPTAGLTNRPFAGLNTGCPLR